MVLQSGALASSVLTFAQSRNVGVSLLVSMGNESMVSMTDVMRYLIDDDATRVIALFIESVRRPDEFLALAREALAKGKPVVAIKVGRSQAGARVARAHTGSLVGDDAVVDAVFRQNGVIRVDCLEDLIITAGLLAETGPLPGNRFGFVTASGGASEIIADRAEDEGIEIPEFAPETVERLRQVVPEFAATQNPVDVTGYILINRDLMRNALAAVQDDPGLDALVLVSDLPRTAPPDPAPIVEMFRQSSELMRHSAKPMIVMGNTLTDITPFGRDVAGQTGYPGVLGGIHHGLTALGRAVRWSQAYRAAHTPGCGVRRAVPAAAAVAGAGRAGRARRLLVGAPRVQVPGRARDPRRAQRPGHRARSRPRRPPRRSATRSWSSWPPTASSTRATSAGSRSGSRNAAEVRAAYADVVAAGRAAGADVQGALVQPQRTGGIELLVGVVTDPAWGQVLAVGLGGVWVEILARHRPQRAPRRPRPGPAGPAQPARRPAVRRPARHREGRPGRRRRRHHRGRRRSPSGSATGSRRWRSTRCWSAAPRSRPSTRSSPGAKEREMRQPSSLERTRHCRTIVNVQCRRRPRSGPWGRKGRPWNQHRGRRVTRPAGSWQWARTAGTQRALLDAAREVFAEQGFADASIAEVVQRAGSSVGSLYHHFGGKSELFVALWQEHQAAHEEAASSAVAQAKRAGETDPFELFSVGARAYLEGSWERRDLVHAVLQRRQPARLRGDAAASRARVDRAERHPAASCRRTRSTGCTRAS